MTANLKHEVGGPAPEGGLAVKFNVNDSVRVKLTDLGRSIHHGHYAELVERLGNMPYVYRPVEEDSAGWSTWQLWVLMECFGQHLHNGCVLPFETEIEFISKPL